MSTPAYLRIKRFIQGRVESGTWSPGDQVPSEAELTQRFHVSRMTANRALVELAAEQVLTRTQGVGTFVAKPKFESTLVEIRNIAEEILSRGHLHGCDVLLLERRVPEEALARELGLRKGAGAFHSLLLHRENSRPVQLEERWVPCCIAPEYGAQDFRSLTPSAYLMQVAPLQKVEYRLEARMPEEDLRHRLELSKHEPCLLLHRRTWSRGRVASVAELWHPGSRYRFMGHF